jgi:hypothetical protein
MRREREDPRATTVATPRGVGVALASLDALQVSSLTSTPTSIPIPAHSPRRPLIIDTKIPSPTQQAQRDDLQEVLELYIQENHLLQLRLPHRQVSPEKKSLGRRSPWMWRWICARIYMSFLSNSRSQHRQVLPNSLGRRRSLSEERVGGALARDDEATRPAPKFVGEFAPQVPPGAVCRQNSSSSKTSSLSISSVSVTSSSPTISPSNAQQSLPWYTDFAEAHAAAARHFSSASYSSSSAAASYYPSLDDSYPSLDDFYPKPSGSGARTHIGACVTRERTG